MPNPDIHPLPFAAFEDVAALSARRSARWLFVASVIYLPVVLIALLIDGI